MNTPSSFAQQPHFKERANAAVTNASEDPDDVLFQQRSIDSRSLSSPIMMNGFGDVLKMEAETRRATAPLAGVESSGQGSDEDDEDDDEEEVEMVDHACQTRESLFDEQQQKQQEPVRSPGWPANVQQQHPYKAERVIEMPRRVIGSTHPTRTNSSSAASSKSGADVVILH